MKKEDGLFVAIATGIGVYWWILALLLIVGSTTVIYAMKPVWLGFERDAMKNSYQYTEAKETMLLQWIAEYDKLEVQVLQYSENEAIVEGLRNQQESLAERIKVESQRVPEDVLHPSVVRFVNNH